MRRARYQCPTLAAFHYVNFPVTMALRALQQSSVQTLTWMLFCPCVIIVAHGWCLLAQGKPLVRPPHVGQMHAFYQGRPTLALGTLELKA
jgi:hypothetical protein